MAIKQRKQVTGTTEQINQYAGVEGQLVWDKSKKTWVGMSGSVGKNYPMAPMEFVNNELSKKQPTGDYATSTQLTDGLAGKANLEHTHTVDNVTGLQTALNTIQDKIPRIGNRGNTRGWNEASEGYNVQQDASDLQWANSADRNVTVPAGTAGTSWVKAVFIHRGTVTLRANWHWANGEAPELKYPCVLVCYWNNNKGIASVINGIA